MKYTGLLFELDKPTANGTIYSKEEMLKAIEKFNSEGRHFGTFGDKYDCFGELDHPIRMDEITHEIMPIEMKEDGYGNTNVFGTIETLPTPQGKIAEDIIENSALALRGIAHIDCSGNVTKLNIESIDIVARNSALGDQHPKPVEQTKTKKIGNMEVKFVKVCGFWFVDIPCKIDRVLDMQMVDGADKLLDEILNITGNDCYVYVDVDCDEPDLILEKTEEDEIGASYFVNSNIDGITTKKIWLCNVCKEVLGEHPDSISIKIINK